MKMYYKRTAVWLVILGLIVGINALRGRNMTNIAETSPEHEDAGLKTRHYPADLKEVKNSVDEIVPTLSTYLRSWRLIESETSSDNKSATIKTEVPVVIFTDDLKVELKSEGDETLVNIRSASRIGRDDFGQNRRHILQLLEKLDEKFAGKNQ